MIGETRGWRYGLVVVSCVAVVLLVVQLRIDRVLGPPGIVGLELAGGPARAMEIVGAWSPGARAAAAFGLGLDFLFALAYAAALGGWCLVLSRGGRLTQRIGLAGAVAAAGAGALDTVENVALAHVILGGATRPWAALATVCAVPKFALAGLAVLMLVVLLILRVSGRGGEGRVSGL